MISIFHYREPPCRFSCYYKRNKNKIEITKTLLTVCCLLAALEQTLHLKQELPEIIHSPITPLHILSFGGIIDVCHSIYETVMEFFE